MLTFADAIGSHPSVADLTEGGSRSHRRTRGSGPSGEGRRHLPPPRM